MRQRELETIEDDIAGVEERLEEIAAEMAIRAVILKKHKNLMKEETELNEKLEYMMERWAYLTELVRGLTSSKVRCSR